MMRRIYTIGLLFIAILLFIPEASAAVSIPNTINYQGRLLDTSKVPKTGDFVFRFSLWSDADWDAGDTNGDGSINAGAVGYGLWQEAQTVTLNDLGLFTVQIGSVTALPNFNTTDHLYMQVEVKAAGEPDTSFEVLDPDGNTANATDRKPMTSAPTAVNADTLDNADVGTAKGNIALIGSGDTWSVDLIPGGTNEDSFILDVDDSATEEIQLIFGQSLDKHVSYDISNDRFTVNDDLNVEGGIRADDNLVFTGTSRESQNMTVHQATSCLAILDPAPQEGQMCWDSDDDNLYLYDASIPGWILIGGASTEYTEGDGINMTDAEISVDADLGVFTFNAGQLDIKDQGISDSHLEFGIALGQINANDIPVLDAGAYFTVDYVETALQELAADTEANETNIGLNAADISGLASDVADNAADIATNTSDIAANAADIATNTADIAANTADDNQNKIHKEASCLNIASPFEGQVCWDTDDDNYYVYDSSIPSWLLIGGADTTYVAGEGVDITDTTISVDPAASFTFTGGELDIAADGVNDTHIDFGTGVNQVGGFDVPLADTGAYFTTDDVESALQEVAGDAALNEIHKETSCLNITSPFEGQVCWDTDDDNLYLYDGGIPAWILIGGASTEYTEGDGIDLTDSEISVDADSGVFTFNAGQLDIASDGIDDTHLDFGTGVNQVSGVDMPLEDAGAHFTTDNVESALQEVAGDVDTNASDIATNTADIATNTADIATNASDIADNAADIATNTTDIANNTIHKETDCTSIGSPFEGQVCWDTDDDNYYTYDGAVWVLVGGDDTAYTGDNGIDLSGTSFSVDSTSVFTFTGGELDIAADGVNDTHIDFGTGVNQVGGDDIPLADAGAYFTTDDVESALQELAADVATNTSGIGTNAADIATNTTNDNSNRIHKETSCLNISSPFEGQVCWDTDDDNLYLYDAGVPAWTLIGGASTEYTEGDGIDLTDSVISVDPTSVFTFTGGQLDLATDGVDDTHLDFGTGVGQINGVDIPLTDAGAYFTVDNAEAALQDVAGDAATNTSNISTNASDISTNTADIATNTSDIATNASDISTNTADVATNTSDILTLKDGTTSNSFTLDTDDSGGNVTLQFGSALAETVGWNDTSSRFDVSDDLNVAGNITVTGTVDGRDIAADGTTLDNIESGATVIGIYLRSNASDNYTSGTLTFDNGTTLDIDGALTVDGTTGSINLNGVEVNNLVVDSAASAPGSPVAGQIYHNTTDSKTYVYNGSAWKNITVTAWSDLPTRSESITLAPEYPGAVLQPDGSSNAGWFNARYDGANYHNYYRWRTTQGSMQDYDIMVRLALPDDFVSWQSNPIQFNYRTTDGVAGNNKLDIYLYDTTSTQASLTENTSLANSSWSTYTSSDDLSSGTWTAGDIITIKVKVYTTSTKSAYAGEIILNYNGR